MSGYGDILRGLSGFAWPALIAFAAWRFRAELSSILLQLRQQLASGAAIKSRYFEFRGVDIASFDSRDGRGFSLQAADATACRFRDNEYHRAKNLLLVHRVRPTGKNHRQTKTPTYDISVYLIAHKNLGHVNDVKRVEYYFSRHFVSATAEYGTKYIVENGTDGFAVRTNAYGPMLCIAQIFFHDGSETTVSRYLDFEGTNYRFTPEIDSVDARKLAPHLEAA